MPCNYIYHGTSQLETGTPVSSGLMGAETKTDLQGPFVISMLPVHSWIPLPKIA